jgi:hypothetical protein
MNFIRFSGAVALSFALAPSIARGQDNRIASKSISRVYAVQQSVFAMAEDGRNFSWLDLFGPTEVVTTVEWPWDGAAEGGAAWRQSVLLRANYFISDSQRVARIASAFYGDEPSTARSDSLIFKDTNTVMANGAGLTALALRADTALLGFGRLGIAYARLNAASETSGPLILDDSVAFFAMPSASANALALPSCRWNGLCRADTFSVPSGGLDSVISVTIDSTGDSTWVLIATQKGLRRGLWRGASFPYVGLPGIHDTDNVAVRSVFAAPSGGRVWAFTGKRFFYSDDHGATFRVPASSLSSQLTNYSVAFPPQVAFSGDTSFINFNMDTVGIARFSHDTLLLNTAGSGIDQALINANDSLDIGAGEGSLTGLAVARNVNLTAAPPINQAVLVAGTTLKGIFYRRLDLPAKTFKNLTRLAPLKNGLAQVITYPTLFRGPGSPGAP